MTYQVDFVRARMGSLPAVTFDGRSCPAPIMGYFWVIINPETGHALVMANSGEAKREDAILAFRKVTAAMTEALANLVALEDADANEQ